MDIKDTISKIKRTAMDTASTVAQTAKEGSATVAKKSNDLLELSKLTLSVNSEENKLTEMYAKIGEKICNKYEQDIYIDPELTSECNEVLKVRNSLREFKEKIEEIKTKTVDKK
ncbi:hypothetical protein Z968_00515 [Clostridium novyi A str. 4552]|uniref:Uncharacterized protein n=1 Tax=Clostridium novyi A str. 4552 TaxID=1444289 RepID=A0A0A0IC26_CLONO|nr:MULTISPECIES: hypothetical protein [Clostridium]EDS78228.1 conserved hypothetical protein [Clostridium botulinum C str. Eklund]KGM98467.1 hypothetical protein Z968_00515 [Clostridium novyi A str. 4552]NEZ49080.1 hypothetical protein [Clostridium botulinum]